MSLRYPGWLRARFSILVFCVLLMTFPANAQQTMIGKVRNFKVSPEFFDPPHENQMKSQLEGAEAEPGPNGRILVNGVKLQTFRQNGDPELLIETPHCVYDQTERSVTSGGR